MNLTSEAPIPMSSDSAPPWVPARWPFQPHLPSGCLLPQAHPELRSQHPPGDTICLRVENKMLSVCVSFTGHEQEQAGLSLSITLWDGRIPHPRLMSWKLDIKQIETRVFKLLQLYKSFPQGHLPLAKANICLCWTLRVAVSGKNHLSISLSLFLDLKI